MLPMKIMFMLSIMSVCWWRKNIMMMLLSLEMMIMTLFTIMSMSISQSSISSMLIMLVMMVSASSMGLSMLVSMSHTHNSTKSIHINMMTFDKNYTSYYNDFM